MRHVHAGLIVVALTAGLAAAAPAAAIPAGARITTAGLGPIEIGMTVRQVERANHRRVRPEGDTNSERCSTAKLGRKVRGLFTGDRLARIQVRTRRYATRSGVRVGDTERDVRDTYPGRIVSEPRKYTEGKRLVYAAGDRKVTFETDGRRRVVAIATGRTPEIDYVEDCG